MISSKKELKQKPANPEVIAEIITEALSTITKNLNQLPDVMEADIKAFGNSSHIVLPKEYIGMRAKVIIKKN